MLTERYHDSIEKVLVEKTDFRPYPTASERQGWESLRATTRDRLISRGAERLDFEWPAITARMILGFLRHGDRKTPENTRSIRRGALADLVLAECCEQQGRFLDDIVNGIWCTCEESYWGNLGALHLQKAGHDFPDPNERVVDLFTAETGAFLAWINYLLEPQLGSVSPLVPDRIRYEIETRVLEPNRLRDDFWWMGFTSRGVNNWNPWINSNWLTCVLLQEDGERRTQAVQKILRSMDVFIETYPSDGGCDEGPGYWGRAAASLFDCLELLSLGTNDAVNVYGEELISKMASFIYRTHIDGDWYVNFADASARVTPSAYLVYQFGKRINDSRMTAFGAHLLEQSGGAGQGETLQRFLPQLFSDDSGESAARGIPCESQVWLDQIEVMCARESDGKPDGFFLAAKGGHNAESHNHNDIGTFIVYNDGKPMIIDAGVGTYTGQTFSDRRYELFTMRSSYHNIPTVNGVEQKEGGEYRSARAQCIHSDRVSSLTLDIAQAYPEEAGIVSWNRTIRLERPDTIFVNDVYEVGEVKDRFYLHLMTPSEVEDDEGGTLTLSARDLPGDCQTGTGRVLYDADRFRVQVETVEMEDSRLAGIWGDVLYRINLRATDPKPKDSWRLRITR
ncbi:TPA: heparinase [Candidatus Latescibacteria bacterium]|nr:heparinase [Candidatus Latescibacterota bacterium]